MAKDRVKRRLVVAAIVVNPAMEDWIEHPGQVVESLIAPQVESPTSHSAAHRLGGFITHCGTEVDEVLAQRFFDLLARNVKPRKSNFSLR